MSIKNIIFDLGAVLIDWNPYPVILQSFHNDEEKTNWFFQNIATHSWNLSLDKGKRFADAKVEKTHEFPLFARQIAIYLDDWEKMLGAEIKGTVGVLESLHKSEKYRLFSITNWSFETFPLARKKFPFLTCFDDIVVSGEVKMIKPNLDIYRYSLERFAIKNPKTAVFIDDRAENIAPAIKLGMKGIHYENPSQLSLELKNIGVNHL